MDGSADLVGAVPVTRWDPDTAAAASADGAVRHPRFGCFLGQVDMFDAAAFGVHEAEATVMDPQHRLLSESAAQTLVPFMRARADIINANDGNNSYNGPSTAVTATTTAVGVYVGMTSSSFALVFPEAAGAYSGTGQQPSAAAGRLSFTFGCNGPAVTVDTACSSSLVAAHHALLQIQHSPIPATAAAGAAGAAGGIDTALCGGVHVMVSPQMSQLCQAAGMLSADGRCKALDAAADGYVRGEAAETVAVSTVHGFGAGVVMVIKGVAVNQDGRSGSLTAPHGPSQQAVINAALAHAGDTSGRSVGHLQLHGTGTALGDPIEVNAASAALGAGPRSAARASPVVLAAVKTRAGHGEPAAGITALIAAMSQLASNAVVPILHLRSINPHLTAQLGGGAGVGEKSQVCIPRQAAPAVSVPSAATGVSSFAFQGTNAHAVVAAGAAAGGGGSASASPTVVFERSRFWPVQQVLTPFSLRVGAADPGSASVRLVASLASAGLADMRDHAVGGCAIVPGAAMMELAHAAARGTFNRGNGHAFAIVGATISRPLALSGPLGGGGGGGDASGSELHVVISHDGVVSLQSDAGRQLHLECQVRSVATTARSVTVAGGHAPTWGVMYPAPVSASAGTGAVARVSPPLDACLMEGGTIDAGALDSSFQSAQAAAQASGGIAFGGPFVPAQLGAYFKPGAGDSAAGHLHVAVTASMSHGGGGAAPALTASFALSTSAVMLARVSECVAKQMRVTRVAAPGQQAQGAAARSSTLEESEVMYVPTVQCTPLPARSGRNAVAVVAAAVGAAAGATRSATDATRNVAAVTALAQEAGAACVTRLGMHTNTAGNTAAAAAAEPAWSLLRCAWREAALGEVNLTTDSCFRNQAPQPQQPSDAFTTAYACDEVGSVGGAQTARVLLRAASELSFQHDTVHRRMQQETKKVTSKGPMTELLYSLMSGEKSAALAARANAAVTTAMPTIDSWTVTGGTSGLGLAAVDWITKSSSEQAPTPTITLLGRSGRMSAGAGTASSVFSEASGVCVRVGRADVAAAEDAGYAHSQQRGSVGVLHTSGVLADASLARLTASATRAVFAPKLQGRAPQLHPDLTCPCAWFRHKKLTCDETLSNFAISISTCDNIPRCEARRGTPRWGVRGPRGGALFVPRGGRVARPGQLRRRERVPGLPGRGLAVHRRARGRHPVGRVGGHRHGAGGRRRGAALRRRRSGTGAGRGVPHHAAERGGVVQLHAPVRGRQRR